MRAGVIPEAIALLSSLRLPMEAETVAQAQVEAALVGAFGRDAVSREHRLRAGDRPDFLLDGGIVVEMKGPRHRATPVLRQLARYAAHRQVSHIILLTAKAMAMPPAIAVEERWVALSVINMARAWL